ncbi:MAG: spore maturation protein [Bacilli bacterium]|nr:spore maturation protein [Bacilli bacterium]
MWILVLIIVIYGLYKGNNIYDDFIEGAKESFGVILNLFPTLLGMILSINILVGSGLLNYIFNFVKISLIPMEVIPLMLLRPISGSSSLALLSNILSIVGPDSFTGVLASTMMGSTDTTIYILTVYFGSVGIKKTRYALFNGLLADLFSFIISFIVVTLLYNCFF